MILGFTGTRHGMTTDQKLAVRGLFESLGLRVLHHGCEPHADMEAHAIALKLGAKIVGHPGLSMTLLAPGPLTKMRMYIGDGFDSIKPAYPHLIRNEHIARDGVDGLIAAPSGFVEIIRSGTWATVRYARKARRRIWIVRPDGKIIEENVHGKE